MLKNKIHMDVFTPKWCKVKLKRHSHILVLLTLVSLTLNVNYILYFTSVSHTVLCANYLYIKRRTLLQYHSRHTPPRF